jgi:hypothetical protein
MFAMVAVCDEQEEKPRKDSHLEVTAVLHLGLVLQAFMPAFRSKHRISSEKRTPSPGTFYCFAHKTDSVKVYGNG